MFSLEPVSTRINRIIPIFIINYTIIALPRKRKMKKEERKESEHEMNRLVKVPGPFSEAAK